MSKTNVPEAALARLANAKREKLRDILRRLVANPGNLEEVADEICIDWFPTCKGQSDGTFEVVVGSGKKV